MARDDVFGTTDDPRQRKIPGVLGCISINGFKGDALWHAAAALDDKQSEKQKAL